MDSDMISHATEETTLQIVPTNSEPDEPESEEELPADVLAKIAEANACLAILRDSRSEIQTKIADLKQQLADVHTQNPEFFPLMSKEKFNAMERAYRDADTAYELALKQLNAEIKTIRNAINAKKAEIGKTLTIRGKPLPSSDDKWCSQYKVIRDLEATITETKNRHQIPPPPSQKDREFFEKYRLYDYYEAVVRRFCGSQILPIEKQLKSCQAKLAELNKAIEEETWRRKYLIYALRNGLECDDENLFRVCNKHHMEELLEDEDLRFDCPCYADQPKYDWADDEFYGHSVGNSGGHCTRGTEMDLEWDEDNLPIGFIVESVPENYIRVVRW